ncbi:MULTISPECIES: phage major tail tube protein [Symbiopectobacterium]|uniref:phage major tail tube protein n=1 Tax=Symbiopectobacterium TaxID=801 RepID=UPI001A19EAFA|nr:MULTISPECIES: phage major tail tube protein [Symbiopectobacterium]MBG6248731.1 phage tail protein [Candidatus Symbiopectobacterium sp. PLON1]MBT9429234.1 phage major tail tube protein [Candidatus Symbiopectobacterium endolongispinus]
MALPRKLKFMNLFNDGMSYMGIATAVTLPKLTRKLGSYRGGGMNGAAPGADAVMLRFTGSYQRDDTGEIITVEVVMRGRHKEIDGGESKQGEDTEIKISTQCTYYKLTMDGKEMIEIDTINMIERVNGVDRLEQHRLAIGLV